MSKRRSAVAPRRPPDAAPVVLGPWQNVPRPSDEPYVVGAWEMAELAARQHPLGARALWQGDRPLMLGGVAEIARGEGLCFAWVLPGLSLMMWRQAMGALINGLWNAHHRGMRRISAIVAARHAEGVRLVKRLGFEFAGLETGWVGTSEPMLRYVHCRPEFPEPALVRHQRHELELACLGAWCPEFKP